MGRGKNIETLKGSQESGVKKFTDEVSTQGESHPNGSFSIEKKEPHVQFSLFTQQSRGSSPGD